ncbi:MAG: 4'-phosphopantetheinyl transferase superfamily protein [Aureispira sp.]|nr:4'-phosphopantetheinyl transferase superfamily protein [Aureispira sp.]
MGLILNKNIDDTAILVWTIDQPIEWFIQELEFSSDLLKKFQAAYSNPKSQRHWLASRYALKHIWGINWQDLIRTESRRLYWPNSKNYLSLSHSGDNIALVKSNLKTGIDIQIESPKLERIASKFIAKKDLEQFQQHPNYKDILHIHWCSKEAMFKAYMKGQVKFIEHLHLIDLDLENLEKGQCKGLLSKPNEQENYSIFHQKLANYWLAVVMHQAATIA